MDLVVGTPFYMAPEMLNRQKYNEKVDVWSLGIITYQLLAGVLPFEGKDFESTKKAICSSQVSFHGAQWLTVTQKAKSFIL